VWAGTSKYSNATFIGFVILTTVKDMSELEYTIYRVFQKELYNFESL